LEGEKKSFTVQKVPQNRSRRTVNLKLTPEAEDVVRGVKERYGMTQQAALERFLQFLAEQDPRMQTAMLSPFEEVRRACAVDLLREMADPGRGDPSVFEDVEAEPILPKPKPEQPTREPVKKG
jgi:hypothetical protein